MEKATERMGESERERCRQCTSEKCNEFSNTIYRNVFVGQYGEREKEKGEGRREGDSIRGMGG